MQGEEQRYTKKKKSSEVNHELLYSPSGLILTRKTNHQENPVSQGPTQKQEEEMEKQILKILRVQEIEQTGTFLQLKLPRFTTKFCEKMRKTCVSWLMDIAQQEKLSLLTLHLAVSYIDRISSFLVLPEPSLFCLTCLFVAAKREEEPESVPDTNSLLIHVHNYSKEDLFDMEFVILSMLDWKLSLVSPCHFLEHYLSYCSKSTIKGVILTESEENRFKEFSQVFVEASILDYTYKKYCPSLIASASILTAKKVCGMDQLWTKELEEVTLYKIEDLYECSDKMYQYYEAS